MQPTHKYFKAVYDATRTKSSLYLVTLATNSVPYTMGAHPARQFRISESKAKVVSVMELPASSLNNHFENTSTFLPPWVTLCNGKYKVNCTVKSAVSAYASPEIAIEQKLTPKIISTLCSKYTGPVVVRAPDGIVLMSGQYRLGVRDGTWEYCALDVTVEYRWNDELALHEAARAGDMMEILQCISRNWETCYSKIPGFIEKFTQWYHEGNAIVPLTL